MSTSDWIASFNVVATLAAVAVALYFALDGNRKARAAAVTRANLYAASMAASLQEFVGELRSFDGTITFTDLSSPPDQHQIQFFLCIQAFVLRRPAAVSMEALAALTALPNPSAHRIAMAFDLLDQIQVKASRIRIETFRTWNLDAQAGFVDGIRAIVNEACDLLLTVAGECRKAADIGAPRPTGEELYGPDD